MNNQVPNTDPSLVCENCHEIREGHHNWQGQCNKPYPGYGVSFWLPAAVSEVDGGTLCATTMTARAPRTNCHCDTYPANLGPCATYEDSARIDYCVYCDHSTSCHRAHWGASSVQPVAPQGTVEGETQVRPEIYGNPIYLAGLLKRVRSAYFDREWKAVERLFEAEIEEMEKRSVAPPSVAMQECYCDDGLYEEWLLQQWPDEEERRHESHVHGSKMRLAWEAGRRWNASKAALPVAVQEPWDAPKEDEVEFPRRPQPSWDDGPHEDSPPIKFYRPQEVEQYCNTVEIRIEELSGKPKSSGEGSSAPPSVATQERETGYCPKGGPEMYVFYELIEGLAPIPWEVYKVEDVKRFRPVSGEGSGVPALDEPYYVEVESDGCERCSHGKMWNVVYRPEDVRTATSYGNQEEAEEISELMNMAFANGKAALSSPLQEGAPCERCKGTGRKPEMDWDERYRTMPAVRCVCGEHEIPKAIDGINWYWQHHSRTGCTLELPDIECWCGLKRSEHKLDGHKPGAVFVEKPVAPPDTKGGTR